jgi:hypothetical protein
MTTIRCRHSLALLAAAAMPLAIMGCAAERPPQVPTQAISATAGNQRLVYTAEQDGTVWVSDKDSNNILYSGRVSRGDNIVIDPTGGQILVNDQVVLNKDVNHDNHTVFFLSGVVTDSKNGPEVPRALGVPASAVLKAEGKSQVAYRADRDGDVWISDVDTKQIIYTGRMVAGDRMSFEPQHHTMVLNGHPVTGDGLPDHNFQIYFSGDAQPTDAGAVIVGRPALVPDDAILRSEGMGRTEVVADSPGKVWVVDATTNDVIYAGRVLAADTLVVDPASNVLTLDGHGVITTPKDLSTGDRYRVFFRADTVARVHDDAPGH